MNELLPILRDKAAPSVLCDICPDPGQCCKGFVLSPTFGAPTDNVPSFWHDEGEAPVWAWLEQNNLPFIPVRPHESFAEHEGRRRGAWYFECPELKSDGRCAIYKTRPYLCRSYSPASDALCVFGQITPS